MIDQEFVQYVVKALVSQPDEVKVERTIDERGVLLTLHVADEDLGRVIGRRGTTAQSLRVLLRALGMKNDAHYNLRIFDGDRGRHKPEPAEQQLQDSVSVEASMPEQHASTPVAAETVMAPEEASSLEEDVVEEEEEKPSLSDQTKRELSDLDDLDI